MPLTSRAGDTRATHSRITRRSKGARCGFRFLFLEASLMAGLEPMLFHPAVQRAAAQAERLRRLADVALKALQRFANQDTFNRLQTQFFEVLPLPTLRTQSQVRGLNQLGAAHEYGSF